ncbi:hypothetical protein PRIPAC_87018 [Pristionchus pacificus]|uniref:F-box domain-containing protein n=1 Tax=Pristionchus pacificus TaxID=54126 RepID=A0A2A6BTZ9_PRIPA|nr:hypothetical protein PRIPAC_87018 [Pristionchus pacificus]|eukprot:PDM69368.1 hypothetical protein PRIPAC_47670 [Pristionchus pacificus]
MDILALPVVFLHEMMKKVTIQDRLRIRLVCRGFENLVASTHAGFVDHAEFLFESYDDPDCFLAGGYFSGSIGDLAIRDFDFLDGFDDCLSFRSSLFSGITIGRFSLYVNSFPIATKMNIPLYNLQEDDYIVSAELFFKLLAAHNNLELSYVEMTSDDLKKALQAISAHLTNAKSVYLWDNVSTIVNLITSCGNNENSVDGETCGEFVVVKTPRKDIENRYMDTSLSLHYRNCWIYIDNCKWHGGTQHCSMRFGTGEE